MKAFERFIESDAFFPVLVLLLVLLVLVFIWIILSNRKYDSKVNRIRRNMPIDEGAQIKIFDEDGKNISNEIPGTIEYENEEYVEYGEEPKTIYEEVIEDVEEPLYENTLEEVVTYEEPTIEVNIQDELTVADYEFLTDEITDEVVITSDEMILPLEDDDESDNYYQESIDEEEEPYEETKLFEKTEEVQEIEEEQPQIEEELEKELSEVEYAAEELDKMYESIGPLEFPDFDTDIKDPEELDDEIINTANEFIKNIMKKKEDKE